MAEEDNDQKTEQPTGKRLDEARERGQLPISREVTAWVTFATIWLTVDWLGPSATKQLFSVLRTYLQSPHVWLLDSHNFQTLMLDTFMNVAAAVALIFVLLIIAAVFGVMVQTGFFYSLDLIKPDFSRLSLEKGLQRLFSMHALEELGKSIVKILVLGMLVFSALWPIIQNFSSYADLPFLGLMEYLHHQASHIILVVLMAYTVVAVGDFVFQRHEYIKNLRMTKQEVKDEYRQQEGDPMIKNRLRQIRLEKARKRMIAKVPKADVVVTNPTHYAVAMQYDNKKMRAPVVIAKGIDNVALRIREVAEDHQIVVMSNPPLARTLYDTVDLDREIPTDLYKAVAEVISYVYKLKKRKI